MWWTKVFVFNICNTLSVPVNFVVLMSLLIISSIQMLYIHLNSRTFYNLWQFGHCRWLPKWFFLSLSIMKLNLHLFLQSVTPHLSLGGEVFWAGQHRKSGIGYAALFETDKMVMWLGVHPLSHDWIWKRKKKKNLIFIHSLNSINFGIVNMICKIFFFCFLIFLLKNVHWNNRCLYIQDVFLVLVVTDMNLRLQTCIFSHLELCISLYFGCRLLQDKLLVLEWLHSAMFRKFPRK